MARPPLTVAEILALKGVRQLTKLRVETMEDAAAAQAAGIDMLSVTPELLLQPEFRQICPSPFVVGGLEPGLFITEEDYLRISFKLLNAGANAVYCGASLPIVRRLRDEGIPVVGHVGLIPSRRTWTGGFRAVGKTPDSARWILEETRALEEAGAFAAEIEVVPAAVATAISTRTGMLMISMGAGAGCDAQYLFACDVLGAHDGHYPRHARRYADLKSEYEKLHAMRVKAFREFASDVSSGAFPAREELVPLEDEVQTDILKALESR
jgi:3-methyl-2-oxobutanoate hydroxymethyltransferase